MGLWALLDSHEVPHLLLVYDLRGMFHWWDPQDGQRFGFPSCEFHVCPHLTQVTLRSGLLHLTDLQRGQRFGG